MVAPAVGHGRPVADFDVAMLRFANGRVVGGMGDVHYERDIRLEGVSDLARAEQADLFLHIGDGADFGLQFGFRFLEQPQRLGHGEGANAIVKCPRHRQVVAQ